MTEGDVQWSAKWIYYENEI